MALDERDSSEVIKESQRQFHHSTRFRFKDATKQEARKLHRSYDIPVVDKPEKHNSKYLADKRSKKKKKRHDSQKPELTDETKSTDNPHPQDTSTEDIDPEAAFRESLFDAMRDDEGAQFWEGVYGQPIHIYPNTKSGPDGELERMTDDEYAAYVRKKMYEKSYQYLLEEKAKRDASRREKERLSRQAAEEFRESERQRRKLNQKIKMSQKISNQKLWEERWHKYITRWDFLMKGTSEGVFVASIPWPVASGNINDVNSEEIKRFLSHAPATIHHSEGSLSKVLKAERIRWHPDKMQQRFGGQTVDERILQAVTSVFQVIDDYWSKIRDAHP